MSKPAKTSADLLALLKEEMNHYADCPEGISVFVIPALNSHFQSCLTLQAGKP